MKKINEDQIAKVINVRSICDTWNGDRNVFVGNKVIAYRTPKMDDYMHYILSVYKDLFIRVGEDEYASLTDVSRFNRFVPREDWELLEYKLYAETNNLTSIYSQYSDQQEVEGPLAMELLPLTFFGYSHYINTHDLINFLNKFNAYIKRNVKDNLTSKYQSEAIRLGILKASSDFFNEVASDILLDSSSRDISTTFADKTRDRK